LLNHLKYNLYIYYNIMDTDLETLENGMIPKLQQDDNEPLLKPKPKKPRPPRSQKQIETTNKMRQAYLEKVEKMKKDKEEQTIIKQKKKEDLIVKKAIAIKKKQLKEEAILEDISDDETEPEKLKVIKEKIQKKRNVLAKVERELPAKEKIIKAVQLPPAPEDNRIKIIFV